LTFQFWHLKIN